jgi:acylphosphatase
VQKLKSYQITIIGKVQNVGFRYHTHEKAIQLNIKGFVMNKANGNVYVEAEGIEDSLMRFINWCNRGPKWAHVNELILIEQPICNYETFEIKR